LTEHDDAITPLLREAPRLGLAVGVAAARAGPVYIRKHKPPEKPELTKI